MWQEGGEGDDSGSQERAARVAWQDGHRGHSCVGPDGATWSTSIFGALLREPLHAALCCVCGCGCAQGFTFARTRRLVDDLGGMDKQCTEGCIFCLAWCTGVSCMMGYSVRLHLRCLVGCGRAVCF